jgi:hypothetical protein
MILGGLTGRATAVCVSDTGLFLSLVLAASPLHRLQKRPDCHDLGTPELAQVEKMMVPANDDLRASRNGALDNSIVSGICLHDVQPLDRRDVPRHRPQLRLYVPQVFRRALELVAQDAQDFLKDFIGERQVDQPVLGEVEQRLRLAAELKRRHVNVAIGVDPLHSPPALFGAPLVDRCVHGLIHFVVGHVAAACFRLSAVALEEPMGQLALHGVGRDFIDGLPLGLGEFGGPVVDVGAEGDGLGGRGGVSFKSTPVAVPPRLSRVRLNPCQAPTGRWTRSRQWSRSSDGRGVLP